MGNKVFSADIWDNTASSPPGRVGKDSQAEVRCARCGPSRLCNPGQHLRCRCRCSGCGRTADACGRTNIAWNSQLCPVARMNREGECRCIDTLATAQLSWPTFQTSRLQGRRDGRLANGLAECLMLVQFSSTYDKVSVCTMGTIHLVWLDETIPVKRKLMLVSRADEHRHISSSKFTPFNSNSAVFIYMSIDRSELRKCISTCKSYA